MAEIVTIGEATYSEAISMANHTLESFKNNPGHYSNTFNSHLRGKIGELACSLWVAKQGIRCDSVFRDSNRMAEADLIIQGKAMQRCDVKTWDRNHWEGLGRCIAVNQLSNLQTKADIIIWCISPHSLEPGIQVELRGWNTLSDIEAAPQRMTGPADGRKVYNYQVDDNKLREMNELSSLIGVSDG